MSTSSERGTSETASDRRFTSVYAPLVPSGPLPPGVTEEAVANAYKSFSSMRPKRVLLTLGIKHARELPAQRLRKAIDRPEARLARKEDKKEKRRPFFHEALYSYLKKSPQGRNVYARLVEPAEYTVDEHTYLDAARFRSLIEAEKAQTGDVSYPISPRTENEALALFALAFGLLEPEDSYAILEPLLLMGAGFRQFFGIGESAPDVSEQESSTAGSRSSVQKATTRDSVNA